MDKLNRYTKEQALEIINHDKFLKKRLEELKPLSDECEVDDSFEYGNFFNLYENGKVYEDRIVIQWLDNNKDDEVFSEHLHEVVTDSLEEAVVLLSDIEEAEGNLE